MHVSILQNKSYIKLKDIEDGTRETSVDNMNVLWFLQGLDGRSGNPGMPGLDGLPGMKGMSEITIESQLIKSNARLRSKTVKWLYCKLIK